MRTKISNNQRRALLIAALVFVFFGQGCLNKTQLAEFLTDDGVKKAEKKDFDGAKSSFSFAIRIAPEYARAYYERGLVEMDLDEYRAAAGDFHAAAGLYDKDADKISANLYEAQCEIELADFDTAMKIVEKILLMDDNCADCHFLKGMLLFYSDKFKNALQEFDVSLKLDYKNFDNYRFKANCLNYLGEFGKANEEIEKYLKFLEAPDADYFNAKSMALFGLGNRIEAERLINEAIKKAPDDPWLYVRLGMIYLYYGDLKNAKDIADKSVWSSDDSGAGYFFRCAVEYLEGDYETAKDDCSRARFSGDNVLLKENAMLYGWINATAADNPQWMKDVIENHIEDGEPEAVMLPVLKYAAGQIGKDEMFKELKKVESENDFPYCIPYFILAEEALKKEPKSAKQYLQKTLNSCPLLYMEHSIAKYQMSKM